LSSEIPGRNGWTFDTLKILTDERQHHSTELHRAEERFQAERDLRYKEVNVEREKALKIKEEADKVALDLARQIQTYKDEKANELREQISSERGSYATKDDLRAAVEKIEAQGDNNSRVFVSILAVVVPAIAAAVTILILVLHR
jgi:hypothetical protein